MVVSHSDDFKFPVHEDEKNNRELVFHLLLTQWTQIQHTEAGMSKAVFLETAKPTPCSPMMGSSTIWMHYLQKSLSRIRLSHTIRIH